MTVLLFTRDLICASRVASAARQCGLELAQVTDRVELLRRAAAEPASLVLLDLATPGIDTPDLVPQLRAISPTTISIVAFAPHVDGEGLSAAGKAGCDKVLARGQFLSQPLSILSPAGQSAPPVET